MRSIEKLKMYSDLMTIFTKYGTTASFLEEAGLKLTRSHSFKEEKGIEEDAKNFAKDLEALGPTFIKLGQLLSTRSEFLPTEYIEELKNLRDSVSPIEYSEVEKIIHEEFGMSPKDIYKKFEPIPIAAASLGQVHRATLMDGTEVVVKVQKPGIVEIITEDMSSLSKIIGFLDKHSISFHRFNVEGLLEEFKKNIAGELNYLEEAHNLKKMKENLLEFESLIIPQVYESYTRARVLTMDYLEGKNLEHLSNVAITEIDGPKILTQVFKAYLKQIFVDGYFHSDPHMGNLLYMKKDQLGIFDLGMVTRLSPRLKEILLQIVINISEGRGEEAAEVALKIAGELNRVEQNLDSFKEEIASVVKNEYDKSIKQMQAGYVLIEFSKIAARNGYTFPQEMSSIARTLIYLDEVANVLDPEFNPHDAIRDQALSIMRKSQTSTSSISDLLYDAIEFKNLIESFPKKANTILDDIINRKLELKINAIDEDKLIMGFQKVANRITSGLILAAMIIGAAMLMRIETSFIIWGYPGLAIIFFLVAMIGSILLLLNILFRDK